MAELVAPPSTTTRRFGAAQTTRTVARDAVDVEEARHTLLLSALAELAAGVLLVGLGLASVELGTLQFAAVAVGLALLLARAALGVLGVGAQAGWGCAALTAIQLLVMAPVLDRVGDLRVACVVVGLSAVPVAMGLAAGALVPGLHAGRREDATPALLAAAVASAVGVLLSVGIGNVVEVDDDPRLARLVPYAAASMAVVVVAELLGRHRAGAGFPAAFALVPTAALGVQALVLLDSGNAQLDGGVLAAAVAAGVAATGLVVSTALASPRPLVVPKDDAGDGPRLVAWSLAGLVALAAVVRLLTSRPLWLDEAALAERSSGSLSAALDAARASDAHPPLLDALAWAAQQVVGAGDLAVRLPALLCGVLLLPAVYVTAAKLYDRRVGLVAAVVAAISPGMVWMATAARPGVLAALLATLALYTMLRALEGGHLAYWGLFGLTGAALVWAHQFGALHLAVLLVGALALARDTSTDKDTRTAAATPPATTTTGTGPALAQHVPSGWLLAAGIGLVAFLTLVLYRDGVGPPDLLPPLEYATAGAPGAGRSVFGLVGTAVTAVVGFHPEDVTSRLLALWPVGILAAFVLFCRSWSRRGILLLALAATPFVALLVLQAAGVPRDPPFALEWVATAVPMLAIGVARGVTLWGSWPRVRLAGGVLAAVLAVAALDQATRVSPVRRFDVSPAVEQVGREAGRGDVVVYGPDLLGDLVRTEVDGARVVRLDRAGEDVLAEAEEVFVVGGFGFVEEGELDPLLALVEQVSSQRSLVKEDEHGTTKVWRFR